MKEEIDGVLEKNINDIIYSDSNDYFFTSLSDRFEHLNQRWADSLEKRFGKKFKPIYFVSAKQSDNFKKENYIIINKKLKAIKNDLPEEFQSKNLVYLQDYEDLNKEFSESIITRDIIDRLAKKQGTVFMLGFTSSFLDIDHLDIKILGPSPEIATKYDSKIEQARLFEKLGIPRLNTRIYDSLEDITRKENFPFFISASYSSGGCESDTILSDADLTAFYSRLRKINKHSSFLVSDYIDDIVLAPNINAIVIGDNNTKAICVTDQLLKGNKYLGNIYPSRIDANTERHIIDITKRTGDYLSNEGFRGIFGLDFLIDSKRNLYTIDLNPRRQGGYLCNTLMSRNIDLTDIELSIALDDKVIDFEYEDFKVDYSWAHSKIKANKENSIITDSFVSNHPTLPFNNIGSTYKSIFYPKDSIILAGNYGYFIVSGESYEKVLSLVQNEVDEIINRTTKQMYS